MSLWQHKNIHKKHLLWAKIFGICLLFHVVFLFLVFCVYRDNTDVIALSINKKMDYSAPIMFVPYTAPAEIKKPVLAAKPQPTTAPKTLPAKNATTIKTDKPVIPPKKEIIEPAKVAAAEKIVEQKPVITKPIAPTIEPAVIKKEIIPETKPALVEEKLAPTPPIAKALDIQNAPIIPIIPENAIVSNDYREVEALRRGAQLQKELVNTWKPPMGVSPDCVCEITFYVTNTGALQDVNITKKSGVMMYDISARNALYAMKMPRWTYNKPFTITFKQ